MSDITGKLNEDNINTAPPKTRDQEFDEAVERVYRKYGSDLSAFARDVQRDMLKIHDNKSSHEIGLYQEE